LTHGKDDQSIATVNAAAGCDKINNDERKEKQYAYAGRI